MSSFRSLLVLAAIASFSLPIIAEPITTLTKDRISQEIIGKNLTAKRMGIPVNFQYKPDGTVTIKFPLMSSSGTWSYDDNVNGNGICMMLTSGPRQGKTCITFQHLGGNKYRNSEGIELTIQD